MKYGIETYQVADSQLYLAHGKRVSGDPRVEQEVLARRDALKNTSEGEGTLVAIGGAATPENYDTASEFIEDEKGVVVLTFPTAYPEQTFAENSSLFHHFTGSEPFHLGNHTIPEEGDAMLRLSGLAFIVGGDQVRGREAMEAEGWDSKLHTFHEDGNTIAGTSAGAHIQGKYTSYEETMTTGIALVNEVSFDSHNIRPRVERQKDIVAATDVFSLGLPEGGGVIYQPSGNIDVFGNGNVNIVWQANGHQANKILHRGDTLNLHALPRIQPPQALLQTF